MMLRNTGDQPPGCYLVDVTGDKSCKPRPPPPPSPSVRLERCCSLTEAHVSWDYVVIPSRALLWKSCASEYTCVRYPGRRIPRSVLFTWLHHWPEPVKSFYPSGSSGVIKVTYSHRTTTSRSLRCVENTVIVHGPMRTDIHVPRHQSPSSSARNVLGSNTLVKKWLITMEGRSFVENGLG